MIFFYHVSGAWLGYFSFGVSVLSHILYLRNKKIVFSRIGKNSIIVGVFFTAFALITGSLWYNATSGSYGSRPEDFWQWSDGRQTMTFVLLISYLAFLIFRSMIEDHEKKARLSAALGIALFPTVPLSYFSAIIFESLHILINPTPGEPGNIYWDPLKIFMLLFNLIAMTLFFVYVVKELVDLDKKREKLDLLIQEKLMEA
jgi:heme exporter protein C